jgi:hypothetical protein
VRWIESQTISSSLATAWRHRHGPLPAGNRLIPKQPFFLGGEYALDNHYAGDAIQAMRARGNIALQTRDLPEGAKVVLEVMP